MPQTGKDSDLGLMNASIGQQNEVRTALTQALRDELLGPSGGEEEELGAWERPTLRYLVGRLAPVGTNVSAEEDEGSADAGGDADDADTGYSSPITMAMNPSSIGLSFLVDQAASDVIVTFRWGRYDERESADSGPTGRAGQRKAFRRRQWEATAPLTPLSAGARSMPLTDDGVCAEFVVRRRQDGRTAVSAFLVNRVKSRDPDRPPDDEWLFQPEIAARSSDGAGAFAPRGLEDVTWSDDSELLSNELLYWNRPEYAVGHGCAANWIAPVGRAAAVEVHTEILPCYELPRVNAREAEDNAYDMRILGGSGPEGTPPDRLAPLLRSLSEGYRRWIDERLRGELLPTVPDELRNQAQDHIDACETACGRIAEGIQLVLANEAVRKAFCFANRAMALQRERSEIALARRRGAPAPVTAVPARWRAFQLAFILLNLPGMVSRQHPHRAVADLLWFPTGGGKTEAYLGLTAFAVAYRRLRTPLPGFRNDVGVTVLMRYTLRLLTVQQFQRSTTLISACEYLRVREAVWGEEPFSIGLWVGRSATPNQYSDPRGDSGAKEALQRLADGRHPRHDGGSPVQLLYCPWCGSPLTERASGAERPIPGTYVLDDDRERVFVYCSDEGCYFSATNSDGVPVHTVDEQLYRNVPSLVIATVDKFAQMPFNGRIQALFGRVQRRCDRHGFLTDGEPPHPRTHRASASVAATTVWESRPLEPPDLVIQDELHLISGPLGTLVGLYETAVDALASVTDGDRRIGPKVVASTATIRRSAAQVGALFGKGVAVFPPSGMDVTDSWFGTEVPPSEEPGRLYFGVSAPGKSVKTALVRVYAALLSRAKALHEASAYAADPYMTLVGYFNSLRELGGAVRLIEDDVPGRILVLNRRSPSTWAKRTLFERDQLTSNKRAEEVPQILAKLERTFSSTPPPAGEYPIDTVLASNMISAGVDIDRLGLMVVNGQPKTTAEYIQATSRIGRQPPGLVVTVYNWTRPRDLSHYERFRAYHGSLYRFVEATSVTPYSSRARDKGLEGVITAMIRLGGVGLGGEQDAARFDASHPWVEEVRRLVAERAGTASGDQDVAQATGQEVVAAMDRWTSIATGGQLCYSRRGLGPHARDRSPTKRYLVDAQEDQMRDGLFTAPGSLREVESPVSVFLLDPQVTSLEEDDT